MAFIGVDCAADRSEMNDRSTGRLPWKRNSRCRAAGIFRSFGPSRHRRAQASIYNALTLSAVEKLAGFMEDFQRQHTRFCRTCVMRADRGADGVHSTPLGIRCRVTGNGTGGSLYDARRVARLLRAWAGRAMRSG
jgi:hypothetical protein